MAVSHDKSDLSRHWPVYPVPVSGKLSWVPITDVAFWRGLKRLSVCIEHDVLGQGRLSPVSLFATALRLQGVLAWTTIALLSTRRSRCPKSFLTGRYMIRQRDNANAYTTMVLPRDVPLYGSDRYTPFSTTASTRRRSTDVVRLETASRCAYSNQYTA